MTMDNKMFESPQDEIQYWRLKAEEFKQSLEEVREELEEFTISSRELELELETQLEHAELRGKELEVTNEKLSNELDTVKERLEGSQGYLHRQVTQLQEELTRTRDEKEKMQKYIREIEQVNDDLERAKRATVVSLEDFECKLNLAIERNAILESELDEKETLMMTVQRLKDETRDLRQELEVRQVHEEVDVNGSVNSVEEGSSFNRQRSQSSCTQTDPFEWNRLASPATPSGNGRLPLRPRADSSPLTPSGGAFRTKQTFLTPAVRISALNMVGDLLRKVGTLESKLVACRNCVEDPRMTSSMIVPGRRGTIGGTSATLQSSRTPAPSLNSPIKVEY